MEREKIGTIQLPRKGYLLRYYLVYSAKDDYGLAVELEKNGFITSEVCTHISSNKQDVLRLGKEIVRGVVFPGYLSEIVEDQL